MPHGSRIRPKQIAEAFEDRRFYATRVHGVPLKGWSMEVWTPQLGEAGVLDGKVHEGGLRRTVVTRRSQRLDDRSDEEDFSAY